MAKKSLDQVAFRPMEIMDLPQIEVVEKRSFPTPWPRKAFYNELMFNQFAYYTVATYDEKVIGYCGFWLILDEAHITNIAIHPDYRGSGIGEATLSYVMELAKQLGAEKMTLEVRVSNDVAKKMYEKLGFVRSGIRKGYYTDNKEDAMIMWVTLNERKQKNHHSGN